MEHAEGKVALVTGSTSGIGLAMAKLLANKGARVIFHSVRSVDRGQVLAQQYAGASYCQADLTQVEDVENMIQRLRQAYGGVDYLVNNASCPTQIDYNDFARATPAHWHEMYQINVVSPFLLTTALCSTSLQSGLKSVVNISSQGGIFTSGTSIPYAVSKSALNHLTKLLAKTLGPTVRVNAIAPGLIDTPLTAQWHEIRENWKEKAALQRSGSPDELAEFALALLIERNITGQVIVYDGGFNL